MPDESARSAYLGDGVYVQYTPDTGQLWLMVSRPENPDPREPPKMRIERVCLEREAYEALTRFAGECWPDAGP